MTKLTPKNIEWTIADGKIIKKLNDGTFAESEAVPAWTKIINMYSSTASWDVSWTLYRGWDIQTLLQQPWAWATWATWDILLNTLSWSLFIPWWQNYTFEYLS